MLNRRCTQRQFLLRPDRATNETVLYCLAESAQRFGIDLILPAVLSNHHHIVLFDRHGRVVEFAEHLHKFIAKAMNTLRGRWENFWSSEPLCLVRLVNPADVLDKLVYVATNPVKDRLVDRVHHWPGINGLSALLNQRSIRVRRPRHFFRASGPMPAEVTLDLVLPPELGDAEQIRGTLRERVVAMERALSAELARSGERVLGRKAILRQSWRGEPTSIEPRRGLRPRVAARSRWSRVEALRRNSAFVIAYQEARALWCLGLPAIFPFGTYWLRRFAGVPVAAAA